MCLCGPCCSSSGQAERLDLLEQLLLVALHHCASKLADLALQLLLDAVHDSTKQLPRCSTLHRLLLLLLLLLLADGEGVCDIRACGCSLL
jgi:hypothetical protein